MAKRGAAGETRELPLEVRQCVRDHLEKQLRERKWTHRDMEEKWGIDKATISKVRKMTGGIGVWFLLRLREHTTTPIDEIMGLTPFDEDTPLQRQIRKAMKDVLQDLDGKKPTQAPSHPKTPDGRARR